MRGSPSACLNSSLISCLVIRSPVRQWKRAQTRSSATSTIVCDADRRHEPHRRRQNKLRNGVRIAEQCIHGNGLLSPQDNHHNHANGEKLSNT